MQQLEAGSVQPVRDFYNMLVSEDVHALSATSVATMEMDKEVMKQVSNADTDHSRV